MKRREFISLIGGATGWPLAARAQQDRVWQITFLHPYLENDPEVQARVTAFDQGLAALGWTNRSMQVGPTSVNKGRDLKIDVIDGPPTLVNAIPGDQIALFGRINSTTRYVET